MSWFLRMRDVSSAAHDQVILPANTRFMTISAPTSAFAATSVPTTSFDAWTPDLQLLLGHEAEAPLRALIETADGELLSFRPGQVNHQPNPSTGRASTVVQYGARVRWSDGRASKETLVMATGGRIPPNAAVLDGDGVRVGIWRWPFDPDLPGLAAAVDAPTVRRLLADLGMGDGTVRLSIRAYRPGRRAGRRNQRTTDRRASRTRGALCRRRRQQFARRAAQT